jgi:hypothetical protein
VAELALVHHAERAHERLVGCIVCGCGVITSPSVVAAGSRAIGEHAEQRVALGEDAGQVVAVDDQDRADVALLHQARGLDDRRGPRDDDRGRPCDDRCAACGSA